jgi:hypothetical protein
MAANVTNPGTVKAEFRCKSLLSDGVESFESVGAVVVMVSVAIPPFKAPKLQAAPLGRFWQETDTLVLEKLEKVKVVVPLDPEAGMTTV